MSGSLGSRSVGRDSRSEITVWSCLRSRTTSRARTWFERRASSDASPFWNAPKLSAQMLKRSKQSIRYWGSASTPSGSVPASVLAAASSQRSRKCRLVRDATVKIEGWIGAMVCVHLVSVNQGSSQVPRQLGTLYLKLFANVAAGRVLGMHATGKARARAFQGY